jgi:integrase
MTGDVLTIYKGGEGGSLPVPELFARAGDRAGWRYVEFLTAEIRNPNTRMAYARVLHRFSAWCEDRGWRLDQLTPVHVAAYVEQLGRVRAAPSVKQALAAIRMLGDYLVLGQVIPANPASSVRGPKHVVKKGKTPVLTAEEMRQLLDSIDLTLDANGHKVRKEAAAFTIAELRDRALIAVMAYSFARISAVLGMSVGDYRQQGKRCWLRLHEKGGKFHEVPCHHKTQEYLDAYLDAAGIASDRDGPLFRSLDRKRRLTADRLDRREALSMVKRRAVAAGLGDGVCNHSFRATGITVYLLNGGTVEKAQQLAAHESPRTTKLYDRSQDEVSLDEIERIRFE